MPSSIYGLKQIGKLDRDPEPEHLYEPTELVDYPEPELLYASSDTGRPDISWTRIGGAVGSLVGTSAALYLAWVERGESRYTIRFWVEKGVLGLGGGLMGAGLGYLVDRATEEA